MTKAASKRQWGAAVMDEATGARARETFAEVMCGLGPAAPSPSTDIRVRVDEDGRILILTSDAAYALGEDGLVIRCRYDRDGSYVSTYRDGVRVGREAKLPDTMYEERAR